MNMALDTCALTLIFILLRNRSHLYLVTNQAGISLFKYHHYKSVLYHTDSILCRCQITAMPASRFWIGEPNRLPATKFEFKVAESFPTRAYESGSKISV